MNITIKAATPKDGQQKATITIPAADVDAAIKRAYKDVANKYNFQGFRKGRAPRQVIDSMFGKEAVLAQATNDVLAQAEPKVLEELDIVPIGNFSYGDDPALLSEGNNYVAEATIGVRPESKLSSYDPVEIKMPPEQATDAEVKQQLERLLSYQTTYEDIKEKRAAKAGDYVAVDIENIKGADQLQGLNRMLLLDGENLPKELEKGICGMKAGESKQISWTESHEHDDHTHEEEREIKLTLNAIRVANTPELNDEVAKKSFGFDTADEVMAALKEEIENDKKASLPGLKEDRVVMALGERLELDEVPQAYKEQIRNEITNDFLSNLQRQGISLDMYLSARGIQISDFLADLDAQTDERARQSLALDAIVEHNKIEATEEEVLAEFERSGLDDAKQALEQWREEGRLPAVREAVRRTKALKAMTESAKVEVVDEIAEAMKEAEKAAKKPAKKTTAKSTTKKTTTSSAKKSPAKKSTKKDENPTDSE